MTGPVAAAPAPQTIARVPLDRAQRTLSYIWFAFAGCIVALLIAQTYGGAYTFGTTSIVTQAWNWALPQFVPTLSLMIGIFASSALGGPAANPPQVNRGFFRLTIALSVVYLTLVLGTILSEPMQRDDPLRLMQTANLWLAPLQGLAASALGALFVAKR